MAPNMSVEALGGSDVGNFGRSESDRPVHHGMSLQHVNCLHYRMREVDGD